MSAVGVRVRTHTPISGRSKFLEFRNESPITIKQFLWFVTAHPCFQFLKPFWICLHVGHRYLMRPPEAFQFVTTHLCRGSPSFWTTQYDHWPANTFRVARFAGCLLMFPDLGNTVLHRGGHGLMHALRV